MIFLGIAFLAALPLAAAPIVLHLFDRQRSVVIEWGAMQFLAEAAARKRSARRLRHWLLLLLRVSAIAALVLALARPLVPGRWLADADRRETILVLDNSLSTQRILGERSVFDELVSRAASELDELPPGDAIRILMTSPYAAWASPSSERVDAVSRATLRERLKKLWPTDAPGDLRAALLKAVQAEVADEALFERRIVVVTDGQRENWKIDDSEGWTRFREALADARLPTCVEQIELGGQTTQTANVAVNRLRAGRAVVGVGQPLAIAAEVQNYASQASKPCRAVWSLDGETLHEAQVPALAAGQTQELVWTHAFDRTGAWAIACRLDANDELRADNAATLVAEVVERVPVLLVEGATGLAELQQDSYLMRAALGRAEEEESADYRAVFEPRTVSPDRLETIKLDGFRAVVIPNFISLGDKTVERLSQFVAAGGGLWLALGPRSEIRQFNKLLYNDGDGLSPVAIDEMVDENVDDQPGGAQPATINPFQRSHPATVELADDERLDTGEVKISSRFRFRKPASSAEAAVLLELTNGEPLAVERRVGRGRVIVQAVPLAMPWSDLAVSQAFVVMVHDWLGYLAEPGATRHNLPPGESISLHVASTEQADATLSTPAGDVVVTGEPIDDGLTFRTSRTALPGEYSLEIGLSGDAIPFHVDRDPSESNLAVLTADDRKFLAETAGLGAENTAPTAASPTPRSPLWPALLIVLVMLIAGELLLSGAIARQRFGDEKILETSSQWEIETSRSSLPPLAMPTAPPRVGATSVSCETSTPAKREVAANLN